MTPSFKMIKGCEVLEEIINGHMWSEKAGYDMNVILMIKELSLILTGNEFCLLHFVNIIYKSKSLSTLFKGCRTV